MTNGKNVRPWLGKWTDEEIRILKEKYPRHGTNIPELLSRGRTKGAIKRMASLLGIRKIRSEFIPKPSEHLAYVLGVMITDGNISTEGRSIRLATVDKEFADAFSKALEGINIKPSIRIDRRNKYRQGFAYLVRGYNVAFIEFYKSLTLDDVEKLVEGYEAHFLRAVMDGDGNLNTVTQKGRVYFKVRIRIKKNGKEKCELIKKLIEKLGYHPTIAKDNNGFYAVHLSDQEEVFWFLNTIKPTIKRKQINYQICKHEFSELSVKLQRIILDIAISNKKKVANLIPENGNSGSQCSS